MRGFSEPQLGRLGKFLCRAVPQSASGVTEAQVVLIVGLDLQCKKAMARSRRVNWAAAPQPRRPDGEHFPVPIPLFATSDT